MFVGVMPGSSFASRKSTGAGGVPYQFAAGLRVLAVDDDPTCLLILEKMLRNCNYEVTKCNRAETALSFLRGNKSAFDIVVSDVHMPDMDGFKLLEHIGLEMDLPVIMMSADDSKSVVMKGVTHGACDYLIKPIRIEALRNIWQHVVRRRKHKWKDFEKSAGADRQPKAPEELDRSSSANEGHNWKNAKKRKDDEDEAEERGESSSLKKPRVVWSVELHQQFVAAVHQLGVDKAVPKKILELMSVPGLTRENVASHLQKYRLYLRRLSESHHPGSIDASFMGNPDAGYGSFLSLNGLDRLAAGGQHGGQSLATLQAAALGQSNNSTSPIFLPVIDQRSIFSFENPTSRYEEVKSQRLNTEPKQMNLLHGIPTNMELRQLVGLQHSFAGIQSQPVGSNGMSTRGSETEVLRVGIVPSYDVFNHLSRSRPLDWGLQAIDESVTNRNVFGDDRVTAKGESATLHHEQYDQDDLLTAVLKQLQQEDLDSLKTSLALTGVLWTIFLCNLGLVLFASTTFIEPSLDLGSYASLVLKARYAKAYVLEFLTFFR